MLDHLAAGDTFEIPVPGTGLRDFRRVEVIALPGDAAHFCGGASNPQDFAVVRVNGGAPQAIHGRYLAPEFVR